MRMANLALRFLLELACLAALAYWGAGATSSDTANVAVAILAPLAAATVWGIWSAPRAPRRLSGRRLTCLELAWLGCSCVLLALAGAPLAAAILFVVTVANAAVLGRTEAAA